MRQREEAGPGVACQREPCMLGGIDGRDVEIDEAHISSGEYTPGGSGEVAPARADADHEISLRCDLVG